jgi:hypothetical protein
MTAILRHRAAPAACLGRRPDFLWGRLQRASVYAELQQSDAAEKEFGLALRQAATTNDTLARYVGLVNRCSLRLRQQRWDDVWMDLQNAVALRPDFPLAYANLARRHEGRREWALADKEWSRALEQTKDAAIYRSRAQRLIECKDRHGREFEAVVAMCPAAATPVGVIDYRPSETAQGPSRGLDSTAKDGVNHLRRDNGTEPVPLHRALDAPGESSRQPAAGRGVVVMSMTYVNAELRWLVVARAESICGYCLIAEEDTFFGCTIDHIISEKHGGGHERQRRETRRPFADDARGVHYEESRGFRLKKPRLVA